MNRTAFRLATLAALLNGGKTPFPTLAGDQVFDSQHVDIPEFDNELHQPVIILRTDADERTLTERGAGSREVMAYLQIGVLTGQRNADKTYTVGWPKTEASLEAFLDLLEWQIECALWGPGVWGQRWRENFPPGKFTSTPLYSDPEDGRVRLAARDLALSLDGFRMDPVPPMQKQGDATYTPALPDRLLAFFDYIDRDGGGDLKTNTAAMRTMLEDERLPAATTWPPMTALVTSVTLTRAPAPPTAMTPVAQVTTDLLKPVEGT